MTRVLILLSTWNGAKYIEEQLNSILNQDVNGVMDVLIRDDGSSDETLEMIARFECDRVKVIRGTNIGAKDSFFSLLREGLGYSADYYAFADQDDVWLPSKLSAAISNLSDDRPALYCSSLKLVDKNLNPLSIYTHPGDMSFRASLLVNCVTGCTCVLNRALLEKIITPLNVNNVMMHDWWLACSASAFGSIFYDTDSHILHRQHGANHVGIGVGIPGLIAKMVAFFNSSRSSRLVQAIEFGKSYCGYLPAEHKSELDAFISSSNSLLGRLRYVLSRRQSIGFLSIFRFIFKA